MTAGAEITEDVARRVGDEIGVDWDKVDIGQFRRGLEVELEHGTRNPLTNITNNNPAMTGKIALVHILEVKDYYTRLDKHVENPK